MATIYEVTCNARPNYSAQLPNVERAINEACRLLGVLLTDSHCEVRELKTNGISSLICTVERRWNRTARKHEYFTNLPLE